MSIGLVEGLETSDFLQIAAGLNARYAGEQLLFSATPRIQAFIDDYWQRLILGNKLDVLKESQRMDSLRNWQTIDISNVETRDVHELGSEWLCLQTLQTLKLDHFLGKQGFTNWETSLALSHIVSRAVYPASELKTVSFMRENSSICELTGVNKHKITKDHLYGISLKLFGIKDALEEYLSHTTNELFDLEDKIILYDLTNTYFEGEKRLSRSARRGRSKEKRSDCPLLVLALVVNVEGFIKYSAIYEGNRADCTTLGDMIDKLRLRTSQSAEKAVVVIDAGIATEENLKMIVDKGYDYVCVSRVNLKKYMAIADRNPSML